MAGSISKHNGLVARHPVYGDGVVIGEDKYGRFILKLVSGHQVMGINQCAVKMLGEDDIFNTDLFKRLKSTGMIGFVRSPYAEKKVDDPKNLNEGEAGPWACKSCGQTFDPDLPQISYDRGEKGFAARKNMKCPYCGSGDVKNLKDADDKADMYFDKNLDYTIPSAMNQEIEKEPNVPAVSIIEVLIREGVLNEESLGRELVKTGKIGTEGIKKLIDSGVLKKEDFFRMPGFIRAGKELWDKAVDIVWNSGKIIDPRRGEPNYSLAVNTWKNLYKKEYGEYPKKEEEGGLAKYFEKQGVKMAEMLKQMAVAAASGVKMGGRARKEKGKAQKYLASLISDIQDVRDDITEGVSENTIGKVDEILERLSEDNPWHDKMGRFAKGGHKSAKMWSLGGDRRSVARAKGGLVKFRKFSKGQSGKIKDWRKNLGPRPDDKSSHKPPYRGSK